MHSEINNSMYNIFSILDKRNLIVFIFLYMSEQQTHYKQIYTHINEVLNNTHNLFDKNIILFLDLSKYTQTGIIQFSNCFGDIKFLCENTLQVMWPSNGKITLEDCILDLNLDDNYVVDAPPSTLPVRVIDGEEYGFLNKKTGLFLLKNNKSNKFISKINSF